MLRGQRRDPGDGAEHDEAQALLRTRYPQLAAMRIADLPVIALRIARATSWGNLVRSLRERDPAQARSTSAGCNSTGSVATPTAFFLSLWKDGRRLRISVVRQARHWVGEILKRALAET